MAPGEKVSSPSPQNTISDSSVGCLTASTSPRHSSSISTQYCTELDHLTLASMGSSCSALSLRADASHLHHQDSVVSSLPRHKLSIMDIPER